MRATPILILGILGAVMAGCGSESAVDTASAPTSADVTTPKSTIPVATPTTTPATAAPAPTPSPTTTPAVSGAIPFGDTFEDDRNDWGEIIDGEFGTIDIVDGDQRWIDATGRIITWGPGTLIDAVEQDGLDLTNVTVSATVTLVSGTGVIGVSCRAQPDSNSAFQFYDLVVRDGYAAIRVADEQSHFEVLAETESAEVVVPLGTPVTIVGTCQDVDGAAQLSLSVDGVTVLEATDEAPLGNGWPALQAWTFPVHEPIEVHWHEFSVTEPTS